ncbi:cytochrome c oxidase assembly protein [Arthrobacter castelli]|uniref:cytochrome c oxidase assembly protein n=1 Tax=Arthrobacter castelli TaxID=271431 RepID=UPI000685F565|nr:cytochrome c oxidase assembly protein [Arthrobacter castelli]
MIGHFPAVAGPAVTVLVPLHGGSETLTDTNQFVVWALPAAKFVFNISAAAVIGSLILACAAMNPRSRAYLRALNFAGASAVVWTIASIVTAVLAYLDAADEMFAFDRFFGQKLALFFSSIGLGQTWLVTTVLAAVVTMLCFAVRGVGAVALVAAVAVMGLVPLTLNVHPNYGEGHEAGMAALGFHTISAAVWLGGLMTLVVLRPVLDTKQLSVIVRRYSTLALIAFVLLAGSGFLRAQATVGTLENLLSPFGILILVKVFAAIALGIMGLLQRRWFIARMERSTPSGSRYFWALVAAELLLMGLASAVAVTLVQVDTPVPDTPVNFGTLAEGMAGQQLPAEPGISGFLSEFGFDPVWAVLCAAGMFFYLAALRRLRGPVVNWPAQRTVCWTAGLLLLFYVTNGGLNVYQNFLFSAEVLLQMSLTAIIPLLLIAGRPVSLALRAANRRSDGSRGVREWIDAVAGSPLSTVATNPHLAAGILGFSSLIFYYSPLHQWAAADPIGHQWMLAYFLFIGCAFANSIMRTVWSRVERPWRPWYAVPAVMMIHVFLGLAMVGGSRLFSPGWYAAMDEPWGIEPMADQQLGGWYLLILGTVQASVLALLLVKRSRPVNAPGFDPGLPASSKTRP